MRLGKVLYNIYKNNFLTDNGASIVILSSIQSGFSKDQGKGKTCEDGSYTDEETNLLAPGSLINIFKLRLIRLG